MLTAAILAGGRATRFDGRDKSALLVEARGGLPPVVPKTERGYHPLCAAYTGLEALHNHEV